MADNRHRVHDYSDKPCPECGMMFGPNKNQARAIGTGRQKTLYCSADCFSRATHTHDHSHRNCPECGKIFKPTQNQVKRLASGLQENVFCSMDCFRKNKKFLKDDPVCSQCGINFTPSKYQSKALASGRTAAVYCSIECWRKDIKSKRKGESNSHWKGGQSHDRGYVTVRQEGHYQTAKYVGEHILVMEEKIGRRLLPGEIVHHKDENRANNNPNNLEVMTIKEHRRYHMTKLHTERRLRNESIQKSGEVQGETAARAIRS